MPSPKILIVDDSHAVRVTVQRLFLDAGYDTVLAANGFEALERLDSETALIVLDVNMPALDGYGVCEKLREMGPEYKGLPIVFLTSLECQAVKLLGQEFGAYLNKPVSRDKLLKVVEDLLAGAVS